MQAFQVKQHVRSTGEKVLCLSRCRQVQLRHSRQWTDQSASLLLTISVCGGQAGSTGGACEACSLCLSKSTLAALPGFAVSSGLQE